MQDHEGFAAFYERRRSEVHAAVAVTLGDHHLAADAVDEAFVRAAERWGQVSVMDRPAGWVYRVAVNWATSWRRKWSRRPTLPAEVLDREHHDDLDSVTLADGLAGLPLLQRQMLVLRFVLGYSVPETAAALDVAEGTVKSGVHRARQQLSDDVEVSDGTR
ncbi:MAG: sigma-70 family RNA polymerase sigma factor [Intrasporangiaceae bacterium]|nr:sigma-70 family RNA polymerase sigma factor [Intrasporangiaceae bacterium]